MKGIILNLVEEAIVEERDDTITAEVDKLHPESTPPNLWGAARRTLRVQAEGG